MSNGLDEEVEEEEEELSLETITEEAEVPRIPNASVGIYLLFIIY